MCKTGRKPNSSEQDSDNQGFWDKPQERFEQFVSNFKSKGFELRKEQEGNISALNSIRFMEEQIGADKWIIETLQHGLKIVLKEEPEPFEKGNNKSARNYMEKLKEKVNEWETKGYVKKLSSKPKYVNAMSVIKQENSITKEVKFRPVIDMKTINDLVICEKTKLDDLSVVEPMLKEGDFMSSFDLENMYFHVKLHPDSIKYFGFSLPGDQGESIYYHFTIMCYGFNQCASGHETH